MEKTYIVHTAHPVSDYRNMVIEALSLERAVEMGERISGVEVSDAYEFNDTYDGAVFSEEFVTFLDGQVGTWH
ncbi:hypothetical protein O0881_08595 [Janthinobacterium sp. SUN100]|uniref:hypothetical protein n=1 Tax=Janthinobacterium sp. SUN100 TaxID=3004101 RepID=UPI0025B1E856|nr:hypothetical protein [Janthinobacterium sp. SUN100]MDN2702050.1 hypothetical protein [Janthinobacterium sp. SUN100]